MCDDVKFVTYLKMKTNLASLYLVPLLLGFCHLSTFIFLLLLKKRQFLEVEHNVGTEKERSFHLHSTLAKVHFIVCGTLYVGGDRAHDLVAPPEGQESRLVLLLHH